MSNGDRNEFVKAILPSVVALIVGASSSYISFHVTLTLMAEKVTVISARLDRIERYHREHVSISGHPVMDERVKNIMREINLLKGK